MAVDMLPGIDLTALRRYLDVVVPGSASDALSAELLAGGRSNVSYVLERGRHRWVLRRPPLGNVLPSANDMAREHRVLSGMSRAGFPVPSPVAYCDDLSVIGAPFLLMEFVDGVVIADRDDAAALTSPQADSLSDSLVSTLVRLHDTDAETAGLQELGRPNGYLARQVRRWGDQWDLTRTRDLPEFDRLRGWLEDRVGALGGERPWSIVHGDFRVDNVILDRTDLDVRAVLDWEMSTLGDPVADLAVSLVYWTEAGDGLRRDVPVSQDVTSGPGFWSRRRIVEEYVAASGRDVAHLDLCVALAAFKLAVIMESIHKRTLDGQQLGAAGGESMGAATEALTRLGLAATHGDPIDALSA